MEPKTPQQPKCKYQPNTPRDEPPPPNNDQSPPSPQHNRSLSSRRDWQSLNQLQYRYYIPDNIGRTVYDWLKNTWPGLWNHWNQSKDPILNTVKNLPPWQTQTRSNRNDQWRSNALLPTIEQRPKFSNRYPMIFLVEIYVCVYYNYYTGTNSSLFYIGVKEVMI